MLKFRRAMKSGDLQGARMYNVPALNAFLMSVKQRIKETKSMVVEDAPYPAYAGWYP